MGVSSSIQETYRTTRHSFEFIHDAFLPLHYLKRAFNDFPLRDHLNSTVIDGVGKWNGHILVYRFSWKFGQIKCLPFCPSYKKESKRLPLLHRDLSILLKSETLSLLQSLLYLLVYTLNWDTFEIGAGMVGPYPSQKYHVLMKLKMARSGQGWQRLKILLILPSAQIQSRGSSHQTSGATELGLPIISTSRSLMSIANMVPAC